MTIKDIERMRDRLHGNAELYLEVQRGERTDYLWFRSFENLIKYVKKNYTSDLIHKENSEQKIIGVKLFR